MIALRLFDVESKQILSQRLTMADIGRLAGVSASTVSRALSGSPSISEATRQRIEKIVLEHDYVLDVQAKNFRLQRTQTIAMLFTYVGMSRRLTSDPFYMEMMGAITNALDQYDYDLLVARVHSGQDDWCPRYVTNKRVDGIFIIDRSVEDKGIQRLQQLGATFMIWGTELPDQTYPSVGGDSIGGGAMAVRHLAKLGRRKIGFVGGHREMVETHLRRQGYEQALVECGLSVDEDLIAYTDFTPQMAYEVVGDMLNRHPDLDGLFLCSDWIATSAMQIIRERGRSIPQDISIIGYDDIQLATHYNPSLTTIRQPLQEGGRLLVQKLFDLMEGKPVHSVNLPVELIIRESCGG